MRLVAFSTVVERAVADGLAAAALVDRNGTTIAFAGDIEDETAMPLVSLVLYRCKRADLSERLFAGEVLTHALDDREVALCIARRQLFVVAVLGSDRATIELVHELRDTVTRMVRSDVPITPVPGGGGGSEPGPAGLSLIEFGITAARTRAKA